MKEKSYGGLLVVFFVCILALGSGIGLGVAHVGEDLSKEILPTSLTRSSDIVQKIDEKSFEPDNITVKFQTQTKVKKITNNTTSNYTSNSSDSSYGNSSYNYDDNDNSYYHNNNNYN